MRIISNKFKTKCAGTLRIILPGETILLNQNKAYSIHSKEYQQFKEDQETEAKSIKSYIQAQESAMFERFN